MSVVRGCGTRVQGGIYAACPLSPYGMPVEHFLVDPPIPIDVKELGITPVGVKLVERKGVWHIMDWVGSTHYPNLADFFEELKKFGLSRRLSTSLDFKKLTPQSRILLLHSHAYICNFGEYQKVEPSPENLTVPYPTCPKELSEHTRPCMDTMCVRLWYQDVIKGEPVDEVARRVVRKMPSFEYNAMTAPQGVIPEYKTAIFASFPIANLTVIKDPENGTHERSLMLAQEARIPVELADE